MPTVNFPPFDQIVNTKFAPLFENRDRYILAWGGRNGSRSVSVSRILIYRALTHKYFRCIMIRKIGESIKDSCWQTIKDDVEDMGLSSLFRFTKSPLEIHCTNGNLFIARGLDKPEKLKSLKDFTCAWYEEGNQITEDDFITVTTTIRSQKADFLQEIFTFNPETDMNYEDFWLWKLFFKGHSEYSFRHKTTITIKIGGKKKQVESWYTSLHTTYLDNRYLDDEQISKLEGLKDINPYWYTVYTLGHWGNREVSDKFWKGFSRLRHVKDDIYLDIEKPIHIVFDENVNPYPALQIWQFDEIDEIHTEGKLLPSKINVRQVHEICLTNPNNKLKKVARELVRWLTVQGWINMIYIYGDASSKKEDTKLEEGMNYFTMFRDALLIEGYKVRIKKSAKNPPVAMSAEFINECLDSNFGGIHISISSSCKESINDYLLVQEKTDGTMKKPKDSNGVELLGHCSDCFRYVLIEAFKDQFKEYIRRRPPKGKTHHILSTKKPKKY